MNVTVFSTSTCATCHAEMKWMDSQNISYKEVVVDESDDNMNQLLEATGGAFQTPPFTVVEDDDGNKETVAGFDRKKLAGLLDV